MLYLLLEILEDNDGDSDDRGKLTEFCVGDDVDIGKVIDDCKGAGDADGEVTCVIGYSVNVDTFYDITFISKS